MIHYFQKDIENGVLHHKLYDPRYKEFYEEDDLPLSTIAIAAQRAFPNPNRVTSLMRARLINWRGFGNETELYMAMDERELTEIFWEHDMTFLNGAVDHTGCSTVRDRELLAREEQRNFRYGHRDLH